MKKYILFFLIINSNFLALAQNKESLSSSHQKPKILKNSWSFRIGEQYLYDSYLSPLQYKGISYSLIASHARTYKNPKISWQILYNAKYASLLNPAYSSLMQYFAFNIGYASHYNWEPINNFYIGAGAKINAEAAAKFLPRNVNNPGSGDINIRLLASLKLEYILKTNAANISFNYNVSTPILGTMFVPEFGQPYYYIWENLPHSLKETIVFSSFHNNYGANGSFNLDIAFNNFTLRTSFHHNHMFWNANNISFAQKELSAGIGIILNTALFWGKKNL